MVLGLAGAVTVLGYGGIGARAVSADNFPHVTANIDVTDLNKSPVRDDAIPSIAVDPGDSRHIAIVEGDFRTGTCLLHVSTDGGATFTAAKRSPLPAQFEHCTPNAGSSSFPMVWAQDGSLLVGLHAFNGTVNVFDGPVNVVVSRTSNNGDDWQNVVVQRNGPNATGGTPGAVATPGLQPSDSPAATGTTSRATSATATSTGVASTGVSSTSTGTASSTGAATSTGTATSTGAATSTATATSTGSSTSSSAAPSPAPSTTPEPPPANGVFGIYMASDRKGHVYVGWQQRSVTIPGVTAKENRAFIAASGDDGKTFGAAVDVAGSDPTSLPDRRGTSVTIAPDGSVFTFFKEAKPPKGAPASSLTPSLVSYKSTDQGKTWKRSVVSPLTDFLDYPVITAAPMGSGYALAAAWEDQADGPQGQQQVRDIFTSTSTDGGTTWSPRKRATDDPATSYANKFVPGLSAAPNGRIDLAWVDFRNDDGHLLSDTYASSSTDGGATWGPNVRVSDHSSDRHFGQFANYSDVRGPVGVASDDYATYIAWDDSRNASDAKPVQDVYFAALQQAPLPTSSGYTTLRVVGAIIGGLLATGLILVVAALVIRGRRGGARPADAGTTA